MFNCNLKNSILKFSIKFYINKNKIQVRLLKLTLKVFYKHLVQPKLEEDMNVTSANPHPLQYASYVHFTYSNILETSFHNTIRLTP